MGAGKTTAARDLAAVRGLRALDVDAADRGARAGASDPRALRARTASRRSGRSRRRSCCELLARVGPGRRRLAQRRRGRLAARVRAALARTTSSPGSRSIRRSRGGASAAGDGRWRVIEGVRGASRGARPALRLARRRDRSRRARERAAAGLSTRWRSCATAPPGTRLLWAVGAPPSTRCWIGRGLLGSDVLAAAAGRRRGASA